MNGYANPELWQRSADPQFQQLLLRSVRAMPEEEQERLYAAAPAGRKCIECVIAGRNGTEPGDHRCRLERPATGYHVARRSIRESIERDGLDWRRGEDGWMEAVERAAA